MPELRQSLENMGVACGNMETGFSNDQQDSRQQEYNRERLGLHVVPDNHETPSGSDLDGITAEAANDVTEESVGDYQVNVKA